MVWGMPMVCALSDLSLVNDEQPSLSLLTAVRGKVESWIEGFGVRWREVWGAGSAR